jgi:ABC-type uncharacterized transport system fused permease/ATPase subunit
MAGNRKRRALTSMSLEQLVKGDATLQCPLVDAIPIEVRNITLQHPLFPPLLRHANVSAQQGSLICVAGPHGSGRHTFLRALAFKEFPSDGIIFIPSHLRVIHVSLDPVILKRSAWQNLTFSCPDADPLRVVEILKLLGLKHTLQVVAKDLERLELLTDELKLHCEDEDSKCEHSALPDGDDARHWQHRLTHSEIAKIHLVRAFIANPEVLILQRPYRQFSEIHEGHHINGEREILKGAIYDHISHRGLFMPIETVTRRRPRTVFFTAESKAQEEESDVIWRLDHNTLRSMSMSLGRGRERLKRQQSPST